MELSSKSIQKRKSQNANGNSAMMSSISEAWEIMNKHMGMKFDDIGKVFQKWSSEGELVRPPPLILNLLLMKAEKHLPGQNRGRNLRGKRQIRPPRPRRCPRQSRARYRRLRRNRNLVQHPSHLSPRPRPHPLNSPLPPHRLRLPRPTQTRSRKLPRLLPPL